MLASALAVACGGSETAPPPPDNTLTLSAQQVWAGSDFTISSERIARSAQLPAVLLDTIVMPATIADGATLRVSLPPGFPGGEYPVSLRYRDTVLTGPTLSVAGFTGLRQLGAFEWLAYITPATNSGQPEVLGGTPDTVVVLNAATGATRKYGSFIMDHGSGTPNGPGTSWQAGAWVLINPTIGCGLYRLEAAAELIEQVQCSGDYYTAAFTPERFLALNKHDVYISGGEAPMTNVAWPGPAVFSPAGDRVTFPADYSTLVVEPYGHPVYSVPDGTVAYTVPVAEPAAVAFSSDGGLLAIGVGSHVSSSDTTTPRAELYHSADGTPAGSIPLPGWPLAIAFDPTAPLLYVAHYDSALSAPEVDVYDLSSLEQLGQMRVAGPQWAQAHQYAAFAFSSEPALYLVGVEADQIYPLPTFSARFSLPEH